MIYTRNMFVQSVYNMTSGKNSWSKETRKKYTLFRPSNTSADPHDVLYDGILNYCIVKTFFNLFEPIA